MPWSSFDEDAVYKLLTDFKMMNNEKAEELERTKLESANQSANDFLLGRDSFNPPNSESLENMMGGLQVLASSRRLLSRSRTVNSLRSL